MQVEIGAQQRETVRHGGRGRGRLVETEYLPATIATKMDVLGVLAFRRDGKTEYAIGVGVLVCEAAFDQPVEHAIKRHAIKRRFSECLLDLVVTQRPRRRTQQLQDADARRRRACAATPYLRSNGIGIEGGKRHGKACQWGIVRLDHSRENRCNPVAN